MLSLLLTFLPTLVKPVLDYLTRLKDARVEMYIAKTGADRDTALSAIQAASAIQSRWWFVAALQPLFAAPYLAWLWKCVIWDTVLGWGTTEPLRGAIGWGFTIVLSSLFVHGIVDTVLRKQ